MRISSSFTRKIGISDKSYVVFVSGFQALVWNMYRPVSVSVFAFGVEKSEMFVHCLLFSICFNFLIELS